MIRRLDGLLVCSGWQSWVSQVSSRRNSARSSVGANSFLKNHPPKSQPLFRTTVPSAGWRLARLEVTALWMTQGPLCLVSPSRSDTDSRCYLVFTRCLSRWERSVSASLYPWWCLCLESRPRQILPRSPRYFAAKCCCEIFDILPSLAQETRCFAPEKRAFYSLPVQSRTTLHKNRRVGFSTRVSTHVSLRSSKIMSIHSESQWYFGDMISSWAVCPAEQVRNKEIQVSGIDFTQHLDILLRFCRQFPLFQFFDILPKELPAGSVWAYWRAL